MRNKIYPMYCVSAFQNLLIFSFFLYMVSFTVIFTFAIVKHFVCTGCLTGHFKGIPEHEMLTSCIIFGLIPHKWHHVMKHLDKFLGNWIFRKWKTISCTIYIIYSIYCLCVFAEVKLLVAKKISIWCDQVQMLQLSSIMHHWRGKTH